MRSGGEQPGPMRELLEERWGSPGGMLQWGEGPQRFGQDHT
ncbi:unnamed protein product [Linum tenue]|uniref:Uncharacterized protein n=2 Tax=Linum tenue TaxID=586396 RepID=A0AAV0KQ27_9ROSI|nr:unnamed protein product [Linum tenue]